MIDVAIAVRGEMVREVTRAVSGAIVYDPPTGEALRRELHRLQPCVVVLDDRLGRGRWRAMGTVPRIALVRRKPLVVALMNGIDGRSERMAAMAGVWDAVDVTCGSWPDELREAVRLSLRRHHELHGQESERLLADAPASPIAPETAPAAPPADLELRAKLQLIVRR